MRNPFSAIDIKKFGKIVITMGDNGGISATFENFTVDASEELTVQEIAVMIVEESARMISDVLECSVKQSKPAKGEQVKLVKVKK
jgi:hypothetical protein